MAWYHGTFVSLPEDVPFFHFTHFGTRKTAVEVLTDKYYLDNDRGIAHLYEVAISPALRWLDAEDFDSPEPLVWAGRLRNDRRLFAAPDDVIVLRRHLGPPDVERRPERLQRFAAWLTERGFDGFRYVNAHEGMGSVSVAVADPGNITVVQKTVIAMAELKDCFQRIRHRGKYGRYWATE